MGVIKDILRTMDYGPSPESSEHVSVWLEEHESGFGHFINGAFTKPGALFEVANPATAKLLAKEPLHLVGYAFGNRLRLGA